MEKKKSIKRPEIADFFSREHNKLVNFVRKRITDGANRDAEDIIQDVAVKLYDMPDLNVPVEKLSSYIYTAVRNRITDIFRTRKEHLSLDEIDGSAEFLLSNVIGEVYNPEIPDFKEKLYKAIDALSDDERAVIIATEFEDFGFNELAQEWDIPMGTLLSRKKRALDKIRSILIKGGVKDEL